MSERKGGAARAQRWTPIGYDKVMDEPHGKYVTHADHLAALTRLRQRCAYRVLHYVLHYRKNMGLEARQQLAAAILDVPLEE